MLLAGYLLGLWEQGFAPVRAVLYGSYAKGKPRPESDVDLAVWLEQPLEKHWTDYPELLRLASLFHPVSPKFYDAGEGPEDNPFIGEILKNGKEIVLDGAGVAAALAWN